MERLFEASISGPVYKARGLDDEEHLIAYDVMKSVRNQTNIIISRYVTSLQFMAKIILVSIQKINLLVHLSYFVLALLI